MCACAVRRRRPSALSQRERRRAAKPGGPDALYEPVLGRVGTVAAVLPSSDVAADKVIVRAGELKYWRH